MKYGLLITSVLKERIDENCMNMGDMMQTLGILSLYRRMGIPQDQIVEIGINDIMSYDGDYVILPININLSFNWCTNIFPLPSKILPVFLGLSYFSAANLPDSLRDYFRTWAPIGCRDEYTLNFLRSQGIPAYLFGCISATLPRRKSSPRNGTVFLVDIPDAVFPYIPDKIKNNARMISHIYHGEEFKDIGRVKMEGIRLLKKYEMEATLVVTARLHAIAPCIAMGIPVIATVENCSPRMAWIDRLIHLYTKNEYENINWEPDPIDYEMAKEAMLRTAMEQIHLTANKFRNILNVSYFYENRQKSEYGNLYKEILQQMPILKKEPFEYILWGSGQIGINVYHLISEYYPAGKLVGVVDSFCEGEFFGVRIDKPDRLLHLLQNQNKRYVFITTTSGEKDALNLLKSLNKNILGKDYLSFATKNG